MANIPFLNNAYFSAKVGIGTDSPIDVLSLEKTTNINVLTDYKNSTGNFSTGVLVGGNFAINESNVATRLTIEKTSGNVGIGTTSPDLKLDVTHATSGEYVATFQNTAANLELKLGVTSTNYLNIQGQQINNSAAFNMSLQADGGNVGIGTTNPRGKLEVEVPTGTGIDADEHVLISDGVATNPQQMRLGVNTASNYSYIQSAHEFIAYAPLILNPKAGNVGIGTTSPALRLNVLGATGYPATSGTTQTGVFRVSGGTGLYNVIDMGVNESTDTAWIQATRANNLGANDKLAINPNGGNVGIGTTAPSTKLYVDGGESTFNRGNSAGTIATFRGQNAIKAVIGTATSYFTGSVGIGTTSPGAKLDASGTYRLQLRTDDTIPELRSITADGTAFKELGLNGSELILRTSSTERMRIDSAGAIKFNAYGAGTLVTDASGNITVSSGGGAGGPYLPLAGGTMTGNLFIEGASTPKINITDTTNNLEGRIRVANNYMYIEADNSDAVGSTRIILKTDGVEALYLNGNQNAIFPNGSVGIGTTSPDAKLEIVDTSNPGATAGSVIIEGRRDGSANLLTLRARDASAPSSALPNGQGGVIRFQGFDGTDFENMAFIQAAADGQAVANGDAPSFMAFGTSADASSSPTEKMRITSGGNVGIGTTSPLNKTHIVGPTLATGTETSYGLAVSDVGDQTKTLILGYDLANDVGIIQAIDQQTAWKNLAFGISGNSKVGIGTVSPDSKLEISGPTGSYLSGIGFSATGTGARTYRTYIGTNGYFYFDDVTGGSTRLTIDTGGNVGIGTTTPAGTLSVENTGTAGVPVLDIINTSTSTFNHSAEVMTPNMTTGQNNIFVIGRVGSTKNSGYIGYKYSGTAGSNANVLTFGHWGSDNLMNIDGLGNVGIGTTTPKSKLQVAGGIQMAGDTDAAAATKVGTMRYRTGTEYVDVTGAELVINGSFATDANWNKNSNWTISGGTANADGTSNNDINQADNLPTAGSVYRVIFEITARTQGQVRIIYGGATTDFLSAVGRYEYILTATSTDRVRAQCQNSFIGSIDNLSIVEVTAEDASYADMCMQTGSSTYEWVNIVRNTY